MIAHRSHFDTMPCPPPHDVHVVDSSGRVIPEGEDRIADFHRDVARKVLGLIAPGGECHDDYIRAAAREISEPDAHVLTADNSSFHLSAQGRESLAAHGVSLPATLSFEGGDVVIDRPTREALVLSAKQWATRVREDVRDGLNPGRILGSCDRLDAVLAELARML